MAKKATAKGNKQCPVCKMEQPVDNQHCVGCKAVFDDSPKGATQFPPPETGDEKLPDDEAAPNGEESDAET